MYAIMLEYGWLPAMLAVGSLVGSALVSWRARTVFHCCLSVVIFACVFWSLFTIYRMFCLDEVRGIVFMGRERWNFIPLLTSLAVFIIFAVQAFYVLGRRSDAA
jgi:hypothetical protein